MFRRIGGRPSQEMKELLRSRFHILVQAFSIASPLQLLFRRSVDRDCRGGCVDSSVLGPFRGFRTENSSPFFFLWWWGRSRNLQGLHSREFLQKNCTLNPQSIIRHSWCCSPNWKTYHAPNLSPKRITRKINSCSICRNKRKKLLVNRKEGLLWVRLGTQEFQITDRAGSIEEKYHDVHQHDSANKIGKNE